MSTAPPIDPLAHYAVCTAERCTARVHAHGLATCRCEPAPLLPVPGPCFSCGKAASGGTVYDDAQMSAHIEAVRSRPVPFRVQSIQKRPRRLL